MSRPKPEGMPSAGDHLSAPAAKTNTRGGNKRGPVGAPLSAPAANPSIMNALLSAKRPPRLFIKSCARLILCHRTIILAASAVLVCLALTLIWAVAPSSLGLAPPAVGLALVLSLLVLMLLCLWRDIIHPLRHARLWLQSLQAGDLSSRLPESASQARALSGIYHDLNAAVSSLEGKFQKDNQKLERHTRRLEEKTRALAAFYSLAANPGIARSYGELSNQALRAFHEILDLEAAVVRQAKDGAMLRLASGGSLPECEQPAALPPDSPQLRSCEKQRRICVPLRSSADENLGVLSLYLNERQHEKREELTELFTAIGKNLSQAFEDFHFKEDSAQLSVLKEREWLANELHDSLAQTINSMRTRVRLLAQSVRGGGSPEAIEKSIRQIEHSIEEANREVRDLICCFSKTRGAQVPGLARSLDTVIEHFRKTNPETTVYFDQFLPRRRLPEEYEVQIMHIVRESLINVEKHGHASFVRVLICGNEEGHYRVYIQDNGLGMDAELNKAGNNGHIGLKVMRDRAKSIGADLLINSRRGRGTSLELRFRAPPSSAPRG